MLEARLVLSWPQIGENSIKLIDCMTCTREGNGCCMKRKLTEAVVKKIIEWLKTNEDQLQNIDF